MTNYHEHQIMKQEAISSACKNTFSPATLLCGLILFIVLPATAQVNYAVSGGTARVTSSPNASGNIVIASTYNGFPVTSIEDYAFLFATGLTSVTIPNTVTNIGSEAFRATSLTNVTIPNGVTSIGGGAFWNCTSLASVTIPSSVKSIAYDTFAACISLTGVTIPNSVTNIGIGAFSSCNSLTNVMIPNSVTSIGNEAFYYCISLTSVTIPNSVRSIGPEAFSACINLTNVTIPNSVTIIGDKAFIYCTSLTGVSIGTSVTSVGDKAFFGCTSLTNVTIPNSLINIGFGVFSSCTSLTSVTIGSRVTGESTFSSCTSLTSVTIGNSVTNIGDGAFAACTSLTSLMIPNSVTKIGNYAFSSCTNLTSATIGNSVTSIGEGALSGCTGLTSISMDAANLVYSSLGGVLFNKAQTILLTYPASRGGSYVIPSTVTNIGDNFYVCSSLTSVTIPNSLTIIQYLTFSGCTSLTNISVDTANPVYSSLNGVLFNKAQTTLITFPAGRGGSYVIPNSVTYIEVNAFSSSIGLTNITAAADHPVYSSVGGVLFDKAQTTLIRFPGGRGGSYVVPGNATSIGGYAFSSCTSLTSVTIPNSVTNIESYAFTPCASLTNLTFLGDAPFLWGDFYDLNADARVSYYYGTTGWGPTFGRLPTAMLGAPAPQASTGSAEVKLYGFGFTIAGVVNQTIVVEASTNLVDWQPIWTNTLSTVSADFVDPQWLNHPRRFYRLRSN
jgi:hypothetical protein